MISSVSIVLRLRVNDREGGFITAALLPDNETRPCSRVSTTYESNTIAAEVSCWCSDPVAKARALIDDVLRVLRAVESIASAIEKS